MISPKAAAERLGISQSRVRALIKDGKLKAEDIGLDRPLWAIDETELARFAALNRPHHRPRRETMEAKLTRIGIVDDAQRERYQIVYEYSDGTRSSPQGSYATPEQAYEEVAPHNDPGAADLYEQVPVEYWTN